MLKTHLKFREYSYLTITNFTEVDQELFSRDQNSTSKEEKDLKEMAQTEGKEEVVDPMVTEDLMATEEVEEEVAEEATEEVDHKEVAMKEGEAQEVVKNQL